ncbi:MAG: hypothetical protein ACE5LB_09350 [Acidiferrobacterales bacterium]
MKDLLETTITTLSVDAVKKVEGSEIAREPFGEVAKNRVRERKRVRLLQRFEDKLIGFRRATAAREMLFEIMACDRRVNSGLNLLVTDSPFSAKNGLAGGTSDAHTDEKRSSAKPPKPTLAPVHRPPLQSC